MWQGDVRSVQNKFFLRQKMAENQEFLPHPILFILNKINQKHLTIFSLVA